MKADTPMPLVVRMKPEAQRLDEVVVKSKRRSKYSRKNNPAVEMMKKLSWITVDENGIAKME